MPLKNLLHDELLSKHTTFKVGGPAKNFVVADDIEELEAAFDLARQNNLPQAVIGAGSNILCSDDGFSGVVIKLGKSFEEVIVEEDRISAGAAVGLTKLAQLAQEKGLAGLAFAVGIPGTLGGAIYVNAGAYNQSIGPLVESISLYKPKLEVKKVDASGIEFSYRRCRLPSQGIIIGAILQLKKGDRKEISREMGEFRERRRLSQPLSFFSAGSIFRNPQGRRAASLIEEAGCKGLKVGDAVVSEMHANFIVNEGKAKAQDIYQLMMLVRERVHKKFGLVLEPEIHMIGKF